MPREKKQFAKKMSFQDIPQLPNARYQVNVSWEYLEKNIQSWRDRNVGHGCELEPDFQRGHVWTPEQQSKYVEWILQGGFSGKDIFWNCPGWMSDFRGPMQLVDGLQRITAVKLFMNDKLKAFGRYKKDFTGYLSYTICDFIFHINDLPHRSQVLEWYLVLNSGGTVHAKTELDKVQRLLLEEYKMKAREKRPKGGKG